MEAFLTGLFRAPPHAVPASRGTPLSGLPLFHGRRRRRPFSSVVCMVEPYLIAKLDSAEKAWKEMSVVTTYTGNSRIVRDNLNRQKLCKKKMSEMIASELEALSNELADLEEKIEGE